MAQLGCVTGWGATGWGSWVAAITAWRMEVILGERPLTAQKREFYSAWFKNDVVLSKSRANLRQS